MTANPTPANGTRLCGCRNVSVAITTTTPITGVSTSVVFLLMVQSIPVGPERTRTRVSGATCFHAHAEAATIAMRTSS